MNVLDKIIRSIIYLYYKGKGVCKSMVRSKFF